MATLKKVLVAVGFLVVFVVGSASLAAASCAPPLPLVDALADADLVVVGTVTETRSQERVATVAVEDIWKGDPELVIEVAGGPDQPNSLTSVDRSYDVGSRYLFFIREPARHGGSGTFGARYEDNECTDTRLYTTDLDQLRPATARRTTGTATTSPSSSSTAANRPSDDSNAMLAVIAIVGLAVCGTVVALMWRVRARRS